MGVAPQEIGAPWVAAMGKLGLFFIGYSLMMLDVSVLFLEPSLVEMRCNELS